MNIFGFRPFKGKFNLGNSDDIPTNNDGTLIGAIKQINTHLTANSNELVADYQGGKYGFTIDNVFYPLGGGGSMKCVKFGTLAVTNGSSIGVDVSSFNFTSAEDYMVILSGGVSANFWVCVGSKSATAFTISCGQVGAGATVSYQVISFVD